MGSLIKKALGKSVMFCVAGAVLVGGVVFMSSPVLSAELQSSIARGGLLYDKWFAVIKAEKPKDTHPAWPASNTKKKGNATYRCKSCHGWDLMGKDGAYASGSYKTGITGLRKFKGADPTKIIAVMKDSTHGYTGKMADRDFMDLANFVSNGQVDMDKYIDRASKKPKGDAAKGEPIYNTICAKCHGMDGKLPKDMKSFGKQMGNPWEVMHKIMNGQPKESMPALRALGPDVTVDIMSYMATLPK